MIGWIKSLFRKPDDPRDAARPQLPDDPRDAALRQLIESLPDELIGQLAVDLAAAEIEKAGFKDSISESELNKLEKEIGYRLRNPGKHKYPIPVGVAALASRNSQSYPSAASSPISDARLKTNVRPLRNAVAVLMSLKGVEFQWRQEDYPELDFSTYPEVGLLAQDVEAVIPTVVGQNESGYKTVNYGCLVPIVIEAMKEQQVSILKLQERVRLLETEKRDMAECR